MSKVKGLPSPESLAKKMLVRRLTMYYGGNAKDPKACACIGVSRCDDLTCPDVWNYWLSSDRMLHLIQIGLSAMTLHES